jgi:hypothetical protein
MIPQQPPQPPAPAETVSFHFERPGAPLPSFTLTVQPDGNAVYRVSYPPEVPKYSPYAETLRAQPNTEVTMNVALATATAQALFDRVRSTNGFARGCASRAKNIASTGNKTIAYAGATCTYDYADDKTIVALTRTFEGIAFTLDEGRKLELKHRYDRLALDPETQYLIEAVQRGDAVELALIAPTLRSLADDPQVLERVRTRAANLLAQTAPKP